VSPDSGDSVRSLARASTERGGDAVALPGAPRAGGATVDVYDAGAATAGAAAALITSLYK